MSLEVICNGKFYLIEASFHLNTYSIYTSIECEEEINNIIIFSHNPRVNVDSLLYVSNISFDNHDDPLRDITIGSLETTAFISYSHTDIEEIPLHIITNGRKIIQLKFFFS